MPTVETHPPGNFCWFELGTTDQNAAKDFYTQLFGWEALDSPMGPGEAYTIFNLQARPVAAAYTLRPGQTAAKVPSHWMPYIATASADETANKAKEVGGAVAVDPFDVMTLGRMTVLMDPTGAIFSAWQAKDHAGVGLTNEEGTAVWADLNTNEADRAAQFYADLFGWHIDAGGAKASGYRHIKNGEEFIAGIPPAEFRQRDAAPYWLISFQVSDCRAFANKAKQLGAQLLLEPMDIAGVGSMAVIRDGQGAVFAMFQPAH